MEGANLGDEALFLANRMIFDSYELIPDRMRHGNQYSRISVFGGGTVLPDISYWVRPNRYNFAFGVGVHDVAFWPEFDSDDLIEKLYEFRFRLLGVRGEMSRILLRGWGVDAEVIGDPCLILEPSSLQKKRKDLVVFNILSARRICVSDDERMFRVAVEVCKVLKQKGYTVMLVPFCRDDVTFILEVSEASGTSVFEQWRNIQATIDLIASSHALIGERLHSIIFAASACTPFISIAYAPKCFDFAGTMNSTEYAIRTNEVSTEKVLLKFNNLLENWNELHATLTKNVETYRQKIRTFAKRIVNDIDSLPEDKWSTPGLIENVRWRALQQTDRVLHYKAYRVWRAWHRLRRRQHFVGYQT